MNGQNNKERANVVKAMDIIARCINYEDIIDSWLTLGVADGDIDQDTPIEDIEEMSCYLEDESYQQLMSLFLKLMYKAGAKGGLYSDGIVSDTRHIEWR